MKSSDKMWSTGGGNGHPLQYSCLENSMDSMKRKKDTEVPILWPPDSKSRLIEQEPDAGGERLRSGGEGDDRG